MLRRYGHLETSDGETTLHASLNEQANRITSRFGSEIQSQTFRTLLLSGLMQVHNLAKRSSLCYCTPFFRTLFQVLYVSAMFKALLTRLVPLFFTETSMNDFHCLRFCNGLVTQVILPIPKVNSSLTSTSPMQEFKPSSLVFR